ncbi:MAG: hypothetical protein HC905_05590, partial [Bacteroidales bacterium]|nr:hypothetical protein [Bacteroidales bacterium]
MLACDAIFNALTDPALIYDTNMDIAAVNKAFLSKYEFNPVGWNVKDIISYTSCKWINDGVYIMDEQPTPKALRGENAVGALFSIILKGKEMFLETSS